MKRYDFVEAQGLAAVMAESQEGRWVFYEDAMADIESALRKAKEEEHERLRYLFSLILKDDDDEHGCEHVWLDNAPRGATYRSCIVCGRKEEIMEKGQE